MDDKSTFASEWSDEHLLAAIENAQQEAKKWVETARQLEWAAIDRMDERSTPAVPITGITTDTTIGTLKTKVDYDQLTLCMVKEELDSADLKLCFTPAHEETVQVSDKVDVVKLKTIARRVPSVNRILERAKLVRKTGVKIEERK